MDSMVEMGSLVVRASSKAVALPLQRRDEELLSVMAQPKSKGAEPAKPAAEKERG